MGQCGWREQRRDGQHPSVHYGQLRVIRHMLTHGAKISTFVGVWAVMSRMRGLKIWKHVPHLTSLKEISEILEKVSGEHAGIVCLLFHSAVVRLHSCQLTRPGV